MSDSETKQTYRSPVSKLLRFFVNSRDQWKAKCLEAKRENKSLKYRLSKMKVSRDRWKGEAKELRQRLPEKEAPVRRATKNRADRGCRGRRLCLA